MRQFLSLNCFIPCLQQRTETLGKVCIYLKSVVYTLGKVCVSFRQGMRILLKARFKYTHVDPKV